MLPQEGQWVWKNSKMPLTYTNWNIYEPNNAGNEDCAMIERPQHDKWLDVRCTGWSNAKPICQILI